MLYQTYLKNLPLLFRGKVRDVYDLGRELLIVATDRVSAFDVVLPNPIPKKGYVLTRLTDFWLNRFEGVVSSHHSPTKLKDVVTDPQELSAIKDQAVIVKKAKPLPVECVVRGFLLGTGYKDYQKTGTVCGIKLPAGLKLAQKLPEPVFTPATKARQGEHDENISFDIVAGKIGRELAHKIREISLKLYSDAASYADERGILIADTKFEFGLCNGELMIIDEVLTCDSSRFWSKADYRVGISPPSFDKQIVRDYLEGLGWNKKPPAPELPPEVVEKASRRYLEVLEIFTE